MADLDLVRYAEERQEPREDYRITEFVRSWNNVGRRSTTKAADIHVILANLNVTQLSSGADANDVALSRPLPIGYGVQ